MVKCTIGKVVLQGGVVTATGQCVTPKSATQKLAKVVPAAWMHRLVSVSDQLGYSCTLSATKLGSTSGRSFTLVPAGAYAAKVTFTLRSVKAKNRPIRTVAKTVTVEPRGNLLACAKLSTSPGDGGVPPLSPDKLCPWHDPVTEADSGATCGSARAGSCALTQPVTLTGSTVSVGYVACPTGNCVALPSSKPLSWFGSPVTTNIELDCPDGTFWGVGASNIELTMPTGETCSIQPTSLLVTSFSIPQAWAGDTLRVSFVLSGNGGNDRYETGVFQIPGNANGNTSNCPLHF